MEKFSVNCDIKGRDTEESIKFECSVKKDDIEIGKVKYGLDFEGNQFGLEVEGEKLIEYMKHNPNFLK